MNDMQRHLPDASVVHYVKVRLRYHKDPLITPPPPPCHPLIPPPLITPSSPSQLLNTLSTLDRPMFSGNHSHHQTCEGLQALIIAGDWVQEHRWIEHVIDGLVPASRTTSSIPCRARRWRRRSRWSSSSSSRGAARASRRCASWTWTPLVRAEPFHTRSTTVPHPFHTRSTTVPQQFHTRSTTVPQQFHNRSTTVPQPFHNRSTSVPRPFHNLQTMPAASSATFHALVF